MIGNEGCSGGEGIVECRGSWGWRIGEIVIKSSSKFSEFRGCLGKVFMSRYLVGFFSGRLRGGLRSFRFEEVVYLVFIIF